MNNMKTQIELTVYYDGLCKVCSKEINHYKNQVGADKIEFIDICSEKFDASKESLDPVAIHKVMHARKKDGTVVTRVQAFIEIWKVLPKFNWLAKFATRPLILFGLERGYTCFAAIRPFLPRKANEDCSDSPYCEIKNA
jgi:predicted DCC family thiol-disulfide oxidoreductase YuxK